MKRFFLSIQFPIVFILLLSISSCDSDNGFDYMGFEHRYHYEDDDTVVSASEHEFVLSMITDKPGDYIPDDWKMGNIDYLITDKSDQLYGEWFPSKPEDVSISDNSISLDWIKFEKIPGNDGPKLKVVIKENTSGDARGARFSFGNSFKNYDHVGEVCVVQKGIPDKEPFTMKIRYKGKVYSTGNAQDMCSVLTVWEDSYFNYGDLDRQKHRISFVADYNNRKVSRNNLKNIMCLNSGKNWNDRISSYSFNMGIFNRHLKDY